MAPTTTDHRSGEENPLNSAYKEGQTSYSSDSESSSQDGSSGGEHEGSPGAVGGLREASEQLVQAPTGGPREHEGTVWYIYATRSARLACAAGIHCRSLPSLTADNYICLFSYRRRISW